MNGEQMHADVISLLLPILIPLAIYIANWGLKLIGVRSKHWDDVGLSKEAQAALPFIYKDSALIKDFAKILKDEGDLEIFFKKIDTLNQKNWKDKFYRGDKPSGEWDWEEIWFGKSYEFQPDAKRVSNKLIKTNSYKIFSKKHSLSKEDDAMMEKLFYWIITRPNFDKEVDKYILNVVDASNCEKSIQLKDLIPPNLVG
jgi:hypothetical protein